MQPLAKICPSVTKNDLQSCLSFIGPDLDQNTFVFEYYKAAHMLQDIQCYTALSTLQAIHKLYPDGLHTLKSALSRVVAAKPHSADVERLISKYRIMFIVGLGNVEYCFCIEGVSNKYKNNDRPSISPETLWNYLYVNSNMGCLEEFDLSPAVEYWMNDKNRRPNSSETIREWFKGAF